MITSEIYVGSCPRGETPASICEADFAQRNLLQCQIWRTQILSTLGPAPYSCELETRSFPHGEGSTRTVCFIIYDRVYMEEANLQRAMAFGRSIGNSPELEYWSEESRRALGLPPRNLSELSTKPKGRGIREIRGWFHTIECKIWAYELVYSINRRKRCRKKQTSSLASKLFSK